jgi:hypothetical protein
MDLPASNQYIPCNINNRYINSRNAKQRHECYNSSDASHSRVPNRRDANKYWKLYEQKGRQQQQDPITTEMPTTAWMLKTAGTTATTETPTTAWTQTKAGTTMTMEQIGNGRNVNNCRATVTAEILI